MTSLAEKAAQGPISDYKASTTSILTHHADLVAALVAEVEAVDGAVDCLLDEIADDTKASLGADAANACSDDEGEQDEAIAFCEDWIADNVTNADVKARILCVLDGLGIEEGTERIRSEIARRAPQPGC